MNVNANESFIHEPTAHKPLHYIKLRHLCSIALTTIGEFHYSQFINKFSIFYYLLSC